MPTTPSASDLPLLDSILAPARSALEERVRNQTALAAATHQRVGDLNRAAARAAHDLSATGGVQTAAAALSARITIVGESLARTSQAATRRSASLKTFQTSAALAATSLQTLGTAWVSLAGQVNGVRAVLGSMAEKNNLTRSADALVVSVNRGAELAERLTLQALEFTTLAAELGAGELGLLGQISQCAGEMDVQLRAVATKAGAAEARRQVQLGLVRFDLMGTQAEYAAALRETRDARKLGRMLAKLQSLSLGGKKQMDDRIPADLRTRAATPETCLARQIPTEAEVASAQAHLDDATGIHESARKADAQYAVLTMLLEQAAQIDPSAPQLKKLELLLRSLRAQSQKSFQLIASVSAQSAELSTQVKRRVGKNDLVSSQVVTGAKSIEAAVTQVGAHLAVALRDVLATGLALQGAVAESRSCAAATAALVGSLRPAKITDKSGRSQKSFGMQTRALVRQAAALEARAAMQLAATRTACVG